jgi:hypothetical protein
MEPAVRGRLRTDGCDSARRRKPHQRQSMPQKAGACEAKPSSKATALAAGLDAFAQLEQELMQRQQALQNQKQDVGRQQQAGT